MRYPRTRDLNVLVAGFVLLCARVTVAGPASPVRLPAPAGKPYAALLAVPQTLVYQAGHVEVRCHVEDAGVVGSDVDFRVTCDPLATARAEEGWACPCQQDPPDVAPVMRRWAGTGCWAVRADGLWYFPACPVDAAEIENPTAGAEKVLPADLSRWAEVNVEEGTPTLLEAPRPAFFGAERGTVCSATGWDIMGSDLQRAECASPDFAWVGAARACKDEGDPQPGCRNRIVLTAVLPGLAPFSPGAAGTSYPVPLGEDDCKTRILPQLRKEERIAGPALAGAFGPPAVTVVVPTIVDPGTGWTTVRFGTFALVAVYGATKRLDLPAPGDGAVYEFGDTFAQDVDGDGRWEVVLLTTQMAGVGPNATDPFPVAIAYDWDGQQFRRLPEVERRIGSAKTIAEARAALVQTAIRP